MADVGDLERTIAHNRSKLLEHAQDQPHLAALAAYDAITELLVAVVNELRESPRA
jgi:hypothetical protein